MNHALFSLLVCLLLVFEAAAQTMPEEMNDFYWELANENYKGKLKILKERIEQEPNQMWYYFMRAEVYEMMGELDKAESDLKEMVRLAPEDANSHVSLGKFYLYNDSTKLDIALEEVNKAIAIEDDWFFHVFRGNIYIQQKEFQLALQEADYLFSLEEIDYMPATELVVYGLLGLERKDILKEFMTKHPLTQFGGYHDTKLDVLIGDLYMEFEMLDYACLSYRFAADPYEMMGEEIPNHILERLEGCKD